MKKNIWVMLLLVFYGVLKAQNEWDTVWTRIYSGYHVHDIDVDQNGYYIAVGDIEEDIIQPYYDAVVLRLDPQTGDTLWRKIYRSPETSTRDHAFEVAVDLQGNYVVVGQLERNGDPDLWVLKVNPQTGDTIWTRTYGSSSPDAAYSVTIDPSGNYYIITGTYSNYLNSGNLWILKLDPQTGDTIFSRTYAGGYYEAGYSVAVDPQGYYVVGGEYYQSRMVLLKIDPQTGDTVWHRLSIYSGHVDKVLIEPSSGEYVLLTHSGGYNYLFKVEPQTGDVLLVSDSLVVPYAGDESLYSMTCNSEGYYIAVGRAYISDYDGYDGLIVKIDPQTGNILQYALVGASSDDAFLAVSTDRQGSYIVGGYAYYEQWFLKFYGVPVNIAESDFNSPGGSFSFSSVVSKNRIKLNLRPGKRLRFEIFTPEGRKILDKDIRSNILEVWMPGGTYFLKSIINGKIYKNKILIIK